MTSGEAPGSLGSRAGAANGRLGPETPLNRCSKFAKCDLELNLVAISLRTTQVFTYEVPECRLGCAAQGMPSFVSRRGHGDPYKGLLTAPKGVTAAGYHPNLINTHIYKIGEVKQRTIFIL